MVAGHAHRAGIPGFTLVEILVTMAVIVTIVTIGLPLVRQAIDQYRAAAAARYLAGRCALARMEAVKRSVRVGLRFEGEGPDTRYAAYVDGNGNGIRTADIRRGTDWLLLPSERIGDLFPGVAFGLHPAVPEVGERDISPGIRDPLRIGSSNIVTFTPIGTATSGTLYLLGRGQTQFAVRILGVTGRTRVLRFESGAKEWITQ